MEATANRIGAHHRFAGNGSSQHGPCSSLHVAVHIRSKITISFLKNMKQKSGNSPLGNRASSGERYIHCSRYFELQNLHIFFGHEGCFEAFVEFAVQIQPDRISALKGTKFLPICSITSYSANHSRQICDEHSLRLADEKKDLAFCEVTTRYDHAEINFSRSLHSCADAARQAVWTDINVRKCQRTQPGSARSLSCSPRLHRELKNEDSAFLALQKRTL